MRRSGYLLALLAAASGAMLAPSVTERATLPTPGGQVENQKQGPQTPAPAPSAKDLVSPYYYVLEENL